MWSKNFNIFRTAEESRKKQEKKQKLKRYALIGLATAGGGAIIGLTGGLAAPLVAAGAGLFSFFYLLCIKCFILSSILFFKVFITCFIEQFISYFMILKICLLNLFTIQ